MPLDIRFVPIVLQFFVSKISSISNHQKTDREQSLLNTEAVTNGFGAGALNSGAGDADGGETVTHTRDTTWVLQSSGLQLFGCCTLFGEWHKKESITTISSMSSPCMARKVTREAKHSTGNSCSARFEPKRPHPLHLHGQWINFQQYILTKLKFNTMTVGWSTIRKEKWSKL